MQNLIKGRTRKISSIRKPPNGEAEHGFQKMKLIRFCFTLKAVFHEPSSMHKQIASDAQNINKAGSKQVGTMLGGDKVAVCFELSWLTLEISKAFNIDGQFIPIKLRQTKLLHD